jgi:hypothetical protein
MLPLTLTHAYTGVFDEEARACYQWHAAYTVLLGGALLSVVAISQGLIKCYFEDSGDAYTLHHRANLSLFCKLRLLSALLISLLSDIQIIS